MPPPTWVKKYGLKDATAMWNDIRTRPRTKGRVVLGRRRIRQQLMDAKKIFDSGLRTAHNKEQIRKLANNLFGKKSFVGNKSKRGFSRGFIGPVTPRYHTARSFQRRGKGVSSIVQNSLNMVIPKSKTTRKYTRKGKDDLVMDIYSSGSPTNKRGRNANSYGDEDFSFGGERAFAQV